MKTITYLPYFSTFDDWVDGHLVVDGVPSELDFVTTSVAMTDAVAAGDDYDVRTLILDEITPETIVAALRAEFQCTDDDVVIIDYSRATAVDADPTPDVI